MRLYMLLILLLLSNCGKYEKSTVNLVFKLGNSVEAEVRKQRDWIQKKSSILKYKESNPEFDVYKYAFLHHIGETETTIPINFDSLPFGTAGQCVEYSANYKEVFINYDHWIAFDDTERKLLIFHELGHCILGKPHVDLTKCGLPISIMNSYLIGNATYLDMEEAYNKELFSNNNYDIVELLEDLCEE